MSIQGLTSSRVFIGEFYKTLSADSGARWIDPISMMFQSGQGSEDYKWLGQSPAMREWIGGRNAKGFRENGLTIANKHYEATIEIYLHELRRDKTGQAMTRIRELAQRTNSHWASLLSTLILGGTAATCYDGQYFFDTDHTEGANVTSQSNDIEVDISALPASVHGVVANPSPEEAQQAIFKGITQILGIKDDQNEPMNEDASSFLVMCPVSLYIPLSKSIRMPAVAGVTQQELPPELSVSVAPNARFTGVDDFYVFRTDGNVKPFIRQEETAVELDVIGEGSEHEFKHKAHLYGVDAWRNVGYGYWQHACYVKMT